MIETIARTPQDETAYRLYGFGPAYSPYTWLKWVSSTVFGSWVSQSVIPAQQLKDDSDYVMGTLQIEQAHNRKMDLIPEVSQNLLFTQTHDGAKLETCELLHAAQEDKPMCDRDYVIYVQGNGMSFQDTLRYMLEDSQDMQWNVIGFNYRNVMRSEGSLSSQLGLVTDVIAQVERLKAKGVNPENIKLLGHSTGAAIASLVGYIYQLHNEKVKIFNGCSFTSYPDFMYHHLETDAEKRWKGPFVRAKYLLTNFEIPGLEAFRNIDEESKDYIAIKKDNSREGSVPDGVIPVPALLYSGLKPQRAALKRSLREQDDQEQLNWVKDRKVLSFNRIFGCGHNDPVKFLECSQSGMSARQRYREFFNKK